MQEAILDDEASALLGADVDEADFPMQGSAISVPWDEFLRSIGVVEVSSQCSKAYSFDRIADNVPLGSVQYMGDSLTNQLAMCSRHKKCRMWIRARIAGVDGTQLLRDMIRWLVEPMDERGHAKSAFDLKCSYGMDPHKLA